MHIEAERSELNSAAKQQQQKNIWLTVVAVIALMALFLGLFLNKALRAEQFDKQSLRQNGVLVFEQARQVKSFTLIDENQHEFSKDQLLGKTSFIFFGFTHCPDICPTSLSELARFYKKLNTEQQLQTQLLFVSLDPERDTPAVLKPYVAYFETSFKALSGDFTELMKFSRNVNIAFNKVALADGYTIDHSAQVVILNKHGDYAGFIKAPLEPEFLARAFPSINAQMHQ
ncbi:SCO family protein [Agaribacterium haliotis]|uniref:SCO family protein n=1 Tax=Agaribacterium haliotis TaxID=2013869 RepID=UPI000BB59935|nr:SCO family protein [Agaribacterium haliotis]